MLTRDLEINAKILASMRFQQRGLSDRTVNALVAGGIDTPERLLFMTDIDLRSIPGIGRSSLAEIKTYRERFLP